MNILKDNRTVLRARKRALIDRLQQGTTGAGAYVGETGRRDRPRAAEVRYLHRLQAALMRMEDGSYGICMQCGERISNDRIHADPSTTLCAGCKGVG